MLFPERRRNEDILGILWLWGLFVFLVHSPNLHSGTLSFVEHLQISHFLNYKCTAFERVCAACVSKTVSNGDKNTISLGLCEVWDRYCFHQNEVCQWRQNYDAIAINKKEGSSCVRWWVDRGFSVKTSREEESLPFMWRKGFNVWSERLTESVRRSGSEERSFLFEHF